MLIILVAHIRRGLTLTTLVVLGSFLVTTIAKAEEMYGLLVGADSNRSDVATRNNYASSDVEYFGRFLRSHGGGLKPDHVLILRGKDANQSDLRLSIERLAARISPRDILLFYFVGLAVQEDAVAYLLLHDSSLQDFRTTGVALDSVLQMLYSRFRPDRLLLCVDASDPRANHDNIIDVLQKAVTAADGNLLVSHNTRERSWESHRLRHGIFTWFLVKGLRGQADGTLNHADGVVTAGELAAYLSIQVPKMAETEFGPQSPQSRLPSMSGTVISRPYLGAHLSLISAMRAPSLALQGPGSFPAVFNPNTFQLSACRLVTSMNVDFTKPHGFDLGKAYHAPVKQTITAVIDPRSLPPMRIASNRSFYAPWERPVSSKETHPSRGYVEINFKGKSDCTESTYLVDNRWHLLSNVPDSQQPCHMVYLPFTDQESGEALLDSLYAAFRNCTSNGIVQ